jgi:hypothetical protein
MVVSPLCGEVVVLFAGETLVYSTSIYHVPSRDQRLSLRYSAFLGDIKKAFDKNQNLSNLLLDDFFKKAISESQV